MNTRVIASTPGRVVRSWTQIDLHAGPVNHERSHCSDTRDTHKPGGGRVAPERLPGALPARSQRQRARATFRRARMLLHVNAGTEPVIDVAAPATDAASIEQFLAGIGPRAFRFAEIGLRQRDDALDAVQDAMMRMLAYRDRPATEWTPLFWSVLRSRIVDVQRRRTFRLRWLLPAPAHGDESSVDWTDERTPDPSRAHDHREAYAHLVDALAALPRRQREAFTLRVLEELDVATTARVMGCGEGAVKTHLFRARESLQLRLKDWK
jgi:RNA polymerase sigma factor (sigma-70 family)